MPGTSGAIRAGRAFVEFFVDTTKLTRGLKRAQARMNAWANGIGSIGAKLAGLGTAMVAPFALGIAAASRLQETMNKFDVVFAGNTDAMKKWGDNFASEVGRSQEQVARFLSGTQDLLVPIGFETGAAEKMSKDLTTLAVDLASFNNMSDDAVLRDLHAAMTGSGEVMKKYGVIVSEAAVKQEMLNSGLDPKSATDQQKVQARLAIIMRGTTAAQGDALRSAGSYANQMKRLNATFEDTKAELGSAVLPIVTEFVSEISSGVQVVGKWIRENKGLVVSLAKGAVALAGVGVGLLVIAKGVAIAAAGFGFLASIVTALPALVGIGALVAGVVGLAKVTGTSVESIKGKFSGLGKFVGGVWESIKGTGAAAIGSIVEKLKAGDLEGAFGVGLAAIKLMWANVLAELTKWWAPWVAGIQNTWSGAIANMLKVVNNWAGGIKKVMAIVSAEIGLAASQFKQDWAEAWEYVKGLAGQSDRLDQSKVKNVEETIVREKAGPKQGGPAVPALINQKSKLTKELESIDADRSSTASAIDSVLGKRVKAANDAAAKQIADAEKRAAAAAEVFAQATAPSAASVSPTASKKPVRDGDVRHKDVVLNDFSRGARRRRVLDARMTQARQSMGQIVNENAGNVGTFSGRAAGQIGGMGPMQRMAKGIEQVVENTGRGADAASATEQKIDGLMMEAE